MPGTVVAAFDFDGTLTRHDTLLPFLMFVAGKGVFARALVGQIPSLALFLAGKRTNAVAKEHLLGRFLRGFDSEDVRRMGEEFALHQLPRMLRKPMISCLRAHRERGHRCVMVSASLDVYLKPWAASSGLIDPRDVISSKLQVERGRITGKLEGQNCYGVQKVRELKSHLVSSAGLAGADSSKVKIVAYGDSHGDRQMLEAACHGVLLTRRLKLITDPLFFVKKLDEWELTQECRGYTGLQGLAQ